MAKEYLKQNNIEFEDVNVSNDQERAIEMIRKSGQQGVPVLDINGKIIIGFNKPEIDKSLNL
jgi:glutaredoxin